MAIPRGLETQWSKLETMKDLMERLLWAKLKPRLGGIVLIGLIMNKQKTSPASSSPERHDCLMDKNSNGEAQHLTAVLLEANSKALLTDEDIADDDVGAADDGDGRDGDDGADTNVDTNLRC